MRLRVPQESDFSTRLRGPRLSARVGVWLGVCFAVAFVTGLVSHWAKLPDPPVPVPTRPVWGYRLTQGLHIASGTAAVPLLLLKLWSVYPRLFQRPPRPSRALLVHLAERGSIALLVSSAVFQLATGVANIAQWYPWGFSFPGAHGALAWVAVGSLLVHVAVKLPVVREALGVPVDGTVAEPVAGTAPEGAAGGSLTRRHLVRSGLLAAAVAVAATSLGSVPGLRRLSVLAVRSGAGPGGVPVNKTAVAAGVVAAATAEGYRLTVAYDGRERSLTREDLLALPQATVELPIACVEGWSASGVWTGVRVRDLLALVAAPRGRAVRVESLQQRGPYRVTELPASYADDDLSVLALRLDGDPLALDHGFPARLVAPNRPGVLQTKWVTRLEVLG